MSMVFTDPCFGSATRLLRGGGIALIALLFAGCVSDQSGTREIFYRKSDLASYQDTVNSVIVARGTPPRLNCCLATDGGHHVGTGVPIRAAGGRAELRPRLGRNRGC